ncbi:M20 family metallo-hydrolase [Roseibacillus persicicus]|uniref:M20 family metallo-hydrolase n=1 Tax=Roseibacillus persicicus TaxID=454148 RepID=UPI00280FD634|nr:M20 family metallo-hydrolase [Roseibacillus persicicus]MDQ8189736.1 M20 family metallo-hydrolase [Roseibacillus persicicus]
MSSPPIQRALERIDSLGSISDNSNFRVRTLLSPANRRAAATLKDWMEKAGLTVEHTIDGSVRGILPGSNPEAPALLLGSHFDTVIDAGAYDGPLGILSALAAIETLQEEGIELPFPVHILGFSDEEGVRFHTTYIGSLGMLGQLDKARKAATDRDGNSLSFVLATEGWSNDASEICYQAEDVRGYVELHIEQGRVLEELQLPACGVSALVGQTRLKVIIEGQADHAGTTPMPIRRDALAGAAECIVELERLAKECESAVATVGQIEVHPGAANAIPQTATFSVDLRHADNEERLRLKNEFLKNFKFIAARRGLTLNWQTILNDDATPCDTRLTEQILDSVEATTGHRTTLVSGAGHDGVIFSRITPIGMIFVRCRDGLSHHPDEYASPEDIATGIEILVHFLRQQSTSQDG